MILYDVCAGTGSIGFACLLHPRRPIPTLTGFMGSKRRWARLLASALVVEEIERLVLIDAGPWGDVWQTLADPELRAETRAILEELDADPLDELWPILVEKPPPKNPAERAAQYLCLQARSAGTIPIWYNPTLARWESPTGSRTEDAHARGGGRADARWMRSSSGPPKGDGPAVMASKPTAARGRMKTGTGSREVGAPALGHRPTRKPLPSNDKRWRSRGLIRVRTIAERIEHLGALPWDRISIDRVRAQDAHVLPCSTVYCDPPYAHSPRYAEILTRAELLALARTWADRGCRVAVSEAEPLPLGEGWESWALPHSAKPEWVTTWNVTRPPLAEQIRLFA